MNIFHKEIVYEKVDYSLRDTYHWFNFAWSIFSLVFTSILLIVSNLSNLIISLLPIIIIFDITLVLFNMIYRKLKESKSTYEGINERDLPSNLSPALVRILVTNGKIDAVSITSILLDLIDRKIIDIREEMDESSKNPLDFFLEDKNMTIYRINFDDSKITDYEKELLKWFISEYGDGKKVTLLEVKNGLRNFDNSNPPSEKFNNIQQMIMDSFDKDKYLCTSSKYSKIMGIMSGICAFIWIAGILFLFGIETFSKNYLIMSGFYIIFNFVAGLLMFGQLPSITFTQYGINELYKWKALKRYLEQYSLINKKDIKDICLWEHYLTYAVALEVNKTITRKLDKFYGSDIYLQYYSS